MPELLDCFICGLDMNGGPSMGGDRVCSWCDCGRNRHDGRDWDMKTTVLMIGNGSVFGRPCRPGCDRVKNHPGRCSDEFSEPVSP